MLPVTKKLRALTRPTVAVVSLLVLTGCATVSAHAESALDRVRDSGDRLRDSVADQVRDVDVIGRLRDADVVDRLRDDVVDRVRNSDIVDAVRNGNLVDRVRESEIIDQLRVNGEVPNIPSLPSEDAQCAEPLLLAAEWGNHDGGNSLAITPSDCVRTNGLVIRDDVWATIVANQPDADVPGMRDQLLCHMLGAQDKATWNLEPWRPAVGLRDTVLAMCNP